MRLGSGTASTKPVRFAAALGRDAVMVAAIMFANVHKLYTFSYVPLLVRS